MCAYGALDRARVLTFVGHVLPEDTTSFGRFCKGRDSPCPHGAQKHLQKIEDERSRDFLQKCSGASCCWTPPREVFYICEIPFHQLLDTFGSFLRLKRCTLVRKSHQGANLSGASQELASSLTESVHHLQMCKMSHCVMTLGMS